MKLTHNSPIQPYNKHISNPTIKHSFNNKTQNKIIYNHNL